MEAQRRGPDAPAVRHSETPPHDWFRSQRMRFSTPELTMDGAGVTVFIRPWFFALAGGLIAVFFMQGILWNLTDGYSRAFFRAMVGRSFGYGTSLMLIGPFMMLSGMATYMFILTPLRAEIRVAGGVVRVIERPWFGLWRRSWEEPLTAYRGLLASFLTWPGPTGGGTRRAPDRRLGTLFLEHATNKGRTVWLAQADELGPMDEAVVRRIFRAIYGAPTRPAADGGGRTDA